MQTRYKILINCYACSPYRGSEPGMGWNFVSRLAQYHDVTVITEKQKWESDIDRYYSEHPDEECIKFYFIAKERHKLLRKVWPPSYYWYYKKWQKEALQLAYELDACEHFDLVHQLNMVGYREPGELWKMGKPLVWGPIGGTNMTPWCMLPSMGLYGCLYYLGRNLMNEWQMHTSNRVKRCMSVSGQLISATEGTRKDAVRIWGKNSVVIPEVGLIDTSNSYQPANRENADDFLHICWSGQHTYGKSLNIVLKSLSKCENTDKITLHVIGKGTCTEHWKRMAVNCGLKNVLWHGWMERSKAMEIMKSCHLFAISSLSDLTSTVLLEALSYGLPVIALDHCGFSNVITNACGIKIPIHSYKQVITDFSNAISCLEQDETWRRELSVGAFARSREFSWDNKVEMLLTIYDKMIGK